MALSNILRAACAAVLLAPAAHAGDMGSIMVMDSYARASTPTAMAGAAFMQIMNHGDTADRLIAASSPAAKRVELHTHIEKDGVMMMTHVEDGFELPAGATLHLKRGGEHVMFMGLTTRFEQDKMIEVTLTFEQAGDITVQIPVDLTRKPQAGAHGGTDHSNHSGHSTTN
ncbi:copper chaperone PCu(A)C [Algirhabdus cladophorae]|uniref:copper chaperone PCu(A)C n=1 Tax=Algirhabdus cladophorae TaxID=3377108 RepID=UPI003B8474AC